MPVFPTSPFLAFRALLLLGAILVDPLAAESTVPFRLTLPTENDGLFTKNNERFYMYTMRNFEGEVSHPWTAGQYGFVRDQKRTSEGVILTRFHEGIDIRPLRRDNANRPLDIVKPVAAGTVMYVNQTASHSSYGKYAIIEHPFPEGPLYSLYAHLMSVEVSAGQSVTTSSRIGRLGYTGEGIDIVRAHVHVELNLLLSKRFEVWHDRYYRSANPHGLYNGLNLTGLNIAVLLLDSRKEQPLSLAAHFARLVPYFRVAVPKKGSMEILQRYPCLGKNLHLAEGAPSWEIHFTREGIPVAIVPYPERVSAPVVTWVDHSDTYHSYKTRGYLTGSGSKASLTTSGLQYVQLVTGQF